MIKELKMPKPDSQQKGLAGEYYVASILSRLGYDIGITIGRAKAYDMIAIGPSGKTVNIQVKSTYTYYDWLVKEFPPNPNSVVAFVRLGKDITKLPELYFIPVNIANKLIDRRFPNHSLQMNRRDVIANCKDHDFSLIEQLLN